MSFQCNFLFTTKERLHPQRDALLSPIVVLTEFVRLRARNKLAVALCCVCPSVSRGFEISVAAGGKRKGHATMWMLIRRQIFETLSYTRTSRPVGFSPCITRSGLSLPARSQFMGSPWRMDFGHSIHRD